MPIAQVAFNGLSYTLASASDASKYTLSVRPFSSALEEEEEKQLHDKDVDM